MKPKLGIALITCERLESLQALLHAVREFTLTPFELVVADDGSRDGTAAWVRSQGVSCVTGPRQHEARNVNRALYWLLEETECDPILFLEDDARVWEAGWEADWLRACSLWDHVCYTWMDAANVDRGRGTPEDPFRPLHYGTQCCVTSRRALRAVGYVDPRFSGYGWWHREWSWRFSRHLRDQWGWPWDRPPCLQAHVGSTWGETSFDLHEGARNENLALSLRLEPFYRDPWRGDADRDRLLAEIAAARRGG